jgi:hypothetical protein
MGREKFFTSLSLSCPFLPFYFLELLQIVNTSFYVFEVIRIFHPFLLFLDYSGFSTKSKVGVNFEAKGIITQAGKFPEPCGSGGQLLLSVSSRHAYIWNDIDRVLCGSELDGNKFLRT